MKNMNSQVVSDNVMVKNKLKNANPSSESNTKGSLQDGGPQQNMNLDRTGNESVRGMEGSNSDSYPPNSGGQTNISGDNYGGKMNDNMPGAQMSNFSGGYPRNFNMNDQQQHGAGGVTNSTGAVDYTQNVQYNQFVQQNTRPNHPTNSTMPRGPPMAMHGRPGMGNNSMGMMPPSYTPNISSNQQQRPFMSGPTIQQQSGPTPTLNQLLQNPNSSQRYPSGYGEYPMNQTKGDPENTGGNQTYGPQSGWNQQRPMNPYQQQQMSHGGSQLLRNQGPVYDGNRRPIPGYPQHPGMYPNQFSPSSQRLPMGQSRMGQPSSQQHAAQVLPATISSSSSSSSSSQQLSPNPNADKHRATDEPRPAPSTGKSSDPVGESSTSNQAPPTNSSQDSVSGTGSSDDINSDSNSTGTTSRPTPTPTPTSTPGTPHTGATQRLIPSPAGSTGSRSGTPASVTGGNRSSSPMPPRPPSNQVEGQQGRIQSPMANSQGYPMLPQSAMMPPPNQLGYPPGPNKMGPNMMGVGPMGNFNSQYPNQAPGEKGTGNFRGGPGMGMYSQHNSFNGPSSMPSSQYSGFGHSNMGMTRSMNSMNYGGQYPPGGTPNSMGNSQYNNYGAQPNVPPGHHGGPPNTPSNHGGPTSHGGPSGHGGPSSGPLNHGGPPSTSSSHGGQSNQGGPPSTPSSHGGPPSTPSSHSGPPSTPSSHGGPPSTPSSHSGPPSAPSSHAGPPSTPSSHGGPPSAPSSHGGPPSTPSSHGGPPSTPSSHGRPSSTPSSQSGPPSQTTTNNGSQNTSAPSESAQNMQSNVNASATSPSSDPTAPKGAQAAAHAAMMAAANQSVGKPPFTGSGRSRSPSGGAVSSSSAPNAQTPPSTRQSSSPTPSPAQQQPPPPQQAMPPQHHPNSQQQSSGPMSQQQQQHSGQNHPRQPHPGQPGHPGQPHHPGQPQQPGPQPNMPMGPNGPMPHPHQRMYGPGNYPSHMMNHMNYSMNQMNNQIPPNSGMNNMPPHSNSMDSGHGMGSGDGPPAYGQMGPGIGPMGMNSGSIPNRYGMSNSNEMTTTQVTGMSGGCVSVTPNVGPGSANSMPPNSIPPNSMPVNSMCEMNNGIPPNAMAPSTSHTSGAQSMGPHGMGPQGMNSGNHPNSQAGPISGMRPGTPGSQQDNNMADVDVKPTLSSTIAGDTSTTVTQSITTPLTNAMESKPMLQCVPSPCVMGPPPPRTSIMPSQIDSSSQDSHSSSQDSDSEKIKIKSEIKQETSSPATSINEDLDNISSPSWPGTPKPDIKPNEKAERSVFNEVFQKQLDFTPEPDRRIFLERLFLFMEERGNAITQNPTISKQPIDLYKLYCLVKERGGMVDVTKNKKWRDVSGALNIGMSSSAGFTLRKNYAKYIFPLECKMDRDDVDPVPILASLETPSKKESKKNQQQATQQQTPQMGDPFRGPHGQQPFNAFGPGRHPQMGNTDMHGGPMMPPNVSMMPNNMPYEQGGMMQANNMMPNNAMPNSNMGPMGPVNNMGNHMMSGGNHGNMNMGTQGMMGPNGPPTNTSGGGPPTRPISNSDSVSVQNPFADTPPPSQYQRPNMGQQMPPYSAGMHQANTTMSSSYGNYNRNMPGYQGNTNNQPGHFAEVSRISGQNSMSDTSSTGSENFTSQNSSSAQPGPNASGPAPHNQQQFGNRMGPNAGSFNQQPSSQQGPLPSGEPQQSGERSDTPQARQPTPQPIPGKAAPPQLHSTDSNSSTGSSSMRPASQSSSHGNQDPPQTTIFPSNYGNSQGPQQQVTPPPSAPEQMNQAPPQQQQQPPPSSHSNQMGAGSYPNHPQQGPGYPNRPYPQERTYPGYHGTSGSVPYSGAQESGSYSGPPGSAPYSGPPGSGPYPGPKPQQGQQYPGPQSYTPQKSYPDMSQRDGYIAPDARNRDPNWLPGQNVSQAQRFPQHSGATYPNRQMNSGMVPSTGSYPMFNRMMSPHVSQMSPQRPEKSGYYSPQSKIQKPGPMPGSHVAAKKEIVFPSDCVESTQPHLIKRRRIRHKDIGQVDSWRLMMALKSGLLAESTWALDTLSILLYDDSTVAWFGLQHMPGLVEVLLDHYRRCLIKIFDGDFEEMEISSERKKELQVDHPDTSLMEVDEEDDEIVEMKEEVETEEEEEEEDEDKDKDKEETKEQRLDDENVDEKDEVKKEPKPVVMRWRRRSWKINSKLPEPDSLNESNNYTLKTLHGKVVKFEESSPDEWMLKDKHWDIYQGFDSSTFDWQLGRGNTTSHIMTHLETKGSKSFFRKSFFKQARRERKCSSDDQDADLSVYDNSTAVIPKEEGEEHACDPATSSPKPTSLPQEQCLEADKSKSLTCAHFSHMGTDGKNTANNVPKVKSEPTNSDTKPIIKTEPTESSEDLDTTGESKDSLQDLDKKQENMECDNKASVRNNIKHEDSQTMAEDDDLAIIKTGRQLESLKRKWAEVGLEGEAYQHDELPFMLIPESMEEVASRCVCVANIFRSLSFIPGNDTDLARHSGLMLVLGRLLLLHHTHPVRNPEQHKFDREVELDTSDLFEDGTKQWWWDTLDALREHTLVTLANISGQMSLITYPEEICMPILDGLLHWAVCSSAYAQDPLPTMSSHSVLSAQRLVLEALCKLCITDSNVDLLLATPPFSRVVELLGNLVKLIADRNDQVMREFSIVLLSSLVQGDGSAARVVSLHHPSISLLIDFIESAEHQALQIANTHAGISRLQENPEMMGTSLDMLRRTALILRSLTEVPENRNLFQHHQHRLLHLVMSQILDHRVASILSDVLYNCAQLS